MPNYAPIHRMRNKGYSLEDAVKQLHSLNSQSNPALNTFIDSIENSQRGLLR